MLRDYNRIAGQSLERIAALSDSIFAVTMTLLVLDLRAPATEAIHGEFVLVHGFAALAPRLLVYLMSCLTLASFGSASRRSSITSPAPIAIPRGSISRLCSR